jgi:DNA mismatch repair protein MSH6
LISLSIASDYFEGPSCRPTIKESNGPDDNPTFHAKNLGHPILQSDSLGKGSFVPNDVKIGGPGNASFIVLTGPNMGGKSTLLRQVCLTIILAQVIHHLCLSSVIVSSLLVRDLGELTSCCLPDWSRCSCGKS